MATPRIAVDLMGADRAAADLLPGVFSILNQTEAEITVVVPPGLEIPQQANLRVLRTDEFVPMDESPSSALRHRPHASILIAMQALAAKQVDAVFSPGHTGATLSAGMMLLKRLEGIKRPALATPIHGDFPSKVLIDSGANVRCRPDYYVQFAMMGIAYARHILDIRYPKVALLNNGVEPNKGTELQVDAYKRLSNVPIDFVGNLEPHRLLDAPVDVVVCDGYTGNIVLKLLEGMFQRDASWRPAVQGAPLLGLSGVVMVGHGASSHVEIHQAIEHTLSLVRSNMQESLEHGVRRLARRFRYYYSGS